MARVLTIEDDAVTAREIVNELKRRGNEVDWVDNGATGLKRASGGEYDAITLDRMLPGLDGLAVVKALRDAGVQTPVLMISALSDVDERVRGLRAGGDDYLTKPFAPDEMVARIEVLLRRRGAERASVLRVGDLELDLIARSARRGASLLELLPIEFRLLEFLVRNSGQVLTRTMIFESVWGYHFDPGTNVIDVHIGRLRKKVDPPGLLPLIRTVRGSGIGLLKLSDHWRSATTRLILIYGAFFVLWGIVLVGVVYWQTGRYLSHVVDEIVEQRAHYLEGVERPMLPKAMESTGALDLRGVMSIGLFGVDGGYVDGNIERVPDDLPVDGAIHALPRGLERRGRTTREPARGLAQRLETGEVLVIARDTSVIDQVATIIREALLWGITLTVIPGFIGGLLLSRRPLKRVRAIEAAIEPIARGDLGRRLPVSRRGDEVDMLAAIVNRMLDEIERLLVEVKGVCDSIAHDLRTPLTRLRSQLHRLQTGGNEEGTEATLERCIVDVDSLLDRFRALLRISELEDLRRRSGFANVDLGEILGEVHELYAPLAEDGAIAFRLDAPSHLGVHGDRHLLFEAFSNLVANAIKFTPNGGTVSVRASSEARGPRVEITDGGPGIPSSEREAVLQRFYRSESGRGMPAQGFGLGLSIVAAIVRLHGFRLGIDDNANGGARITVDCWAEMTPSR